MHSDVLHFIPPISGAFRQYFTVPIPQMGHGAWEANG
ncbi:hypothetical protein MBUL_03893 [Methylobacterium bullatum]|uniref:Uncharacterized protein n=1 Tax=Methylobacterium bullatum TaxID=570505 RepID=A0A679J6Z3_9HYPH|nr:hypothetical protein MBUL_03893 [Methylobacterium bullatum]